MTAGQLDPRRHVYRENLAAASLKDRVQAPRYVQGELRQVVAAAAMIGGISYFHEFAYELLAENERILAATFDAAIAAHRSGHLDRIIVMSSSMVYESAEVFPTPEGAQLTSPPPISTYGFQKLASEYFAKGAWDAAYRLETLGHEGRLGPAPEAVAVLEAELERLRPALAALENGQPLSEPAAGVIVGRQQCSGARLFHCVHKGGKRVRCKVGICDGRCERCLQRAAVRQCGLACALRAFARQYVRRQVEGNQCLRLA